MPTEVEAAMTTILEAVEVVVLERAEMADSD
jgi:hypothetical protein